MLGTKCPSITSTWIQSAPADSTARTSSPSLAKSAERMDGAMMSGRMAASGKCSGNMRRTNGQRHMPSNAPACLTFCGNAPRQRFQQVRQEVDRKLDQRKIEPGKVGNDETCGRQHQADIAVAGDQADGEGTVGACAQEHKSRER